MVYKTKGNALQPLVSEGNPIVGVPVNTLGIWKAPYLLDISKAQPSVKALFKHQFAKPKGNLQDRGMLGTVLFCPTSDDFGKHLEFALMYANVPDGSAFRLSLPYLIQALYAVVDSMSEDDTLHVNAKDFYGLSPTLNEKCLTGLLEDVLKNRKRDIFIYV